jgi:hypothetical protein
MKWTSAAFGVRFPDAEGAAGPARSAGAGVALVPELPLLHPEAIAMRTTVVD